MRIWDLPVANLCDKHLLGEHRELHGLWNIIVIHKCKGGYSKHPETKRWIGCERALYMRHMMQVNEMKKRGMNHNSALPTPKDFKLSGLIIRPNKINTIDEQVKLLKQKPCYCFHR